MSAICDAHKKKVGVELLYNSVRTGSQAVWRPDQLERRCGRESQHPAEGASGLLIKSLEIRPVGEKMLDWGTCPREAGPPGPRLSSSGEWERNVVMANRVGINMLQFYSVSNSLSHTTLSNKSERYIFLNDCVVIFIVSSLWFCMQMYMYYVFV